MKSVYICWNLEIAAISLRKSCFPHRILEKSQNRNTIRQPNQRHVYRIDRTIDDSGCLLFDLISKKNSIISKSPKCLTSVYLSRIREELQTYLGFLRWPFSLKNTII